jgi:hypothetical protein
MYSLWIALNKYIAELMGLDEYSESEDEELGEQETPESRVRPLDLRQRRQTI